MKLLPIASLTLIASLSLTGCGAAHTLEDQTKLIEYEKCLEHLENVRLELQREMLSEWRQFQGLRTLELIDKRLEVIVGSGKDLKWFDIQIDRCAPYRP